MKTGLVQKMKFMGTRFHRKWLLEGNAVEALSYFAESWYQYLRSVSDGAGCFDALLRRAGVPGMGEGGRNLTGTGPAPFPCPNGSVAEWCLRGSV